MGQVDQTIDSPPPQPPPHNGSVDNDQATIKQEPDEQQADNSLPIQKSLDSSDLCNNNPQFAVICSFIAHFGDKLELDLDIEQLRSSIEDQEHLDESLIELHVKLLKKIRRYFIRDQWLKTLIRFVAEYSWEDATELQTFGYLKTRPSVKLDVLRRLMEAQFEHDTKFKAAVNSREAQELRLLPIGRDIKGNAYWHRTDKEGNFRIFQEEPLDYKSWKTVCSNVGELQSLIEELDKIKDERVKGEPFTEPYNPYPQIYPEYFTKEEDEDEEKEQQGESQQAKTRATKAKKGRGGRGKTKKSLSLLKDIDEENANSDFANDRKSNILDNALNTAKPSQTNLHTIRPIANDPITCNGTIESQVRTTLESLINRVVSSFDYFIRPLSRSSIEKPSDEMKEASSTTSRKRQSRKKEKPAEELPRRSSSRIQQLQQKKLAEQENQLKKMIESNTHKGTLQDDESNAEKQRTGSESPEVTSGKAGRRKRRGEATWRRGKGKKKLSWDRDDSDLSSTSSLTESNNEDDLDDESLQFEANNYDDEFACEEEDTNIEPVIIKRARTARQSLGPNEPGQDESTIIEEDKPCGRCDKSNDPEWILLCDKCDDGYHTACCLPPLMIVPDGDWFCAACEHKMLLEKLMELCNSIKALVEVKERERLKRQRLRQPKLLKETTSDSVVTKRPRDVLEELNEPLAVQALDEELSDNASRRTTSRNRNRKKTKPRRPRRRARANDSDDDDDNFRPSRRARKSYRSSRRSTSDIEDSESAEEESQSSQSEDEPRPKTRRARASVSYRFKEYDELIKSAIQGDSYEEGAAEDRDSGSEPCNYGRGKDMATIEAIAYQQENGLVEPSAENEDDELNVLPGKNKKARKKTRRLNDLDAASETDEETSDESFQASSLTEAEEEEEEDLTEVDSQDETIDEILIPTSSRKRNRKGSKQRKRRNTYESDGSADTLPRTTRRAAARKQVSYKESTDEDEFFEDKIKKSKKTILESDAESEASWARLNAEEPNNDDVSTSIDSPNTITGDGDLDKENPEEAMNDETKTEEKSNMDLKSPETKVPEISVSNESIDELVKLDKKPTPSLSAQAGPTDESPKLQVQSAPKQFPEKMRDPIEELNQYCLDTAQSQTTMFSSYNETLSSKNTANSPPRPKFYDEDESGPVTPDAKSRKSRKLKTYSGLKKDTPTQASESSTKSPSVNLTNIKPSAQQPVISSKNGTEKNEPTSCSPIVPATIPAPSNPTGASTNQRFASPPVSNPMYAVPMQQPMQQPMPRQPLPPYSPHMSKLPQQPQQPISSSLTPQMTPYSPHFGTPMAQYMSPPRHNLHMSPYSNSPPRPNLWPPTGVHLSPDRGSVIRQPMPPLYYPDSSAIPNPNFSIQQILSNPYGHPSFAQQPPGIPPNPHSAMMGQPNLKSSPIGPNSGPIQPPFSTQSSLTENPPPETDNRSNADKDMIRGMSDVISFIGDT